MLFPQFRPTSSMFRLRANLHRACSPDKVLSLTPGDVNLPSYIRPTPMAQIRKWLENHGEDFWEWLVTPPASDGKEMEARELALTTISEILNMDMGVDAEGKPRLDLNIIKLKLDAAKLLVGNKGPMIAIQNNVNEDEERLPRGLRGKSSTQIEARINQITRHIPKESDQFSLEGEIAN